MIDMQLPHLVVTAHLSADELEVSTRSARRARHTLAELRIVEPPRPGRRARPRRWSSTTELSEIARSSL